MTSSNTPPLGHSADGYKCKLDILKQELRASL